MRKIVTTPIGHYWPCAHCGASLRVNKTRRLLGAVCIGLCLIGSIGAAIMVGRSISAGWGFAAGFAAAVVTLPLSLLVDGVKQRNN